MNDFFLADDLSGALEAAAAFHDAGRTVHIALTPAAPLAAAPDDVIGYTTETRNAAPAAAAARVAQILSFAQAQSDGGRFLCKKIDSTLRGPVAAELTAVAIALPTARILFCPANPRVGRTVRDGVLLVHGVPVAETEFARDPANPVRTSISRDLLGAAATSRVIIPDIATEADLAFAVARAKQGGDDGGGDCVFIGSGALARAVAGTLGSVTSRKGAAPSSPAFASAFETPILFVCGSAHPANDEQSLHWRAIVSRRLHPLVAGTDNTTAIAEATEQLRRRRWTALRLAARPAQGGVDSATALAVIANAARAVATGAGVRRVMLTGGETAYAFCTALGIRALKVEGEIEPGLVLASARVDGETWRFAIKPGGFGSEQAWVRAGEGLAALA